MAEIVCGSMYVAEKVADMEYRRFAQRPDWLSEEQWMPVAELISRSVRNYANRSKVARDVLAALPVLKITGCP